MIRICEIDIMFIKRFINIYRNPKTRNWFRYETFIQRLEFKGFSTWGERDTIFLCWLLLHHKLSTQPTCGSRSTQSRLTSPSSKSQLTAFLKSPNPQPTLPVRGVTYIPWSQFPSGIFILTSLNDTSSPRAREHLRSCCT